MGKLMFLTAYTNGKRVQFRYDPNKEYDHYGLYKEMGDIDLIMKKVRELHHILEYGYVNTRRGDFATTISKQQMIRIRERIGMDGNYAWMSRGWVHPLHDIKNMSLYMRPKIPENITVAYFNLKWLHYIPKVICDIVVGYLKMDGDYDTTCFICNTHYKKHTGLRAHLRTAKHLRITYDKRLPLHPLYPIHPLYHTI